MPLETSETNSGITLLAPVSVSEARPDRPVRGDAAIAACERVLTKSERYVDGGLPRMLNPLAYSGALAGFNFIVAAVTGILLLFWYKTSVHTAHESVAAMDAQWWGAGFVRTLHRYSSDACVLFSVIHAVKVFLARKFGGARWIAWVTGVLLLGLIWLDGWLGYWLTWDQRAQAIAAGTAKVLDVLPIFPEPIARSFLTNGDVNSLVFFAVFFAHVLLPIAIGVVIWIHLVRLKKPKFLPKRGLMIATGVVLIVLSLAIPADLAAPADMAAYPDSFLIDWFYLLPLYLTDRLSGPMFWVLSLGLGFVLFSLPWTLGRKRKRPAVVNQKNCNGCTQCFQDCPYEAITMVGIDSKDNLVSLIDPNRCVSCGICVGSCDPGAIAYPELDRPEVRDRVLDWLQESGPKAVAFLCADGAGRGVRFDTETGLSPDLPGYRVVGIPCAAWLHSSFAEMIAKRGGRTLLVACEGSEPRCRLGAEITADRVGGVREPYFRMDRLSPEEFRFLQIEGGSLALLKQEASDFLNTPDGETTGRLSPGRTLLRRILVVALLIVVLGGATVGFTRLAYIPPDRPPSVLIVSFKLAGHEKNVGQDVDTELGHLKGMKGRVELEPVRLRVLVDGRVVHEQSYAPRGIHENSASVGAVEIPMGTGKRRVQVQLGQTADVDEWTWAFDEELEFDQSHRRVVQFDSSHGFQLD
ncbi:MAG: cytochrome b N-terminal domain-containing protein [Planctomycetes bacterium]|nr:cytochrome b N-terminal domain-containing protein [Planctomycetota bacterium]